MNERENVNTEIYVNKEGLAISGKFPISSDPHPSYVNVFVSLCSNRMGGAAQPVGTASLGSPPGNRSNVGVAMALIPSTFADPLCD